MASVWPLRAGALLQLVLHIAHPKAPAPDLSHSGDLDQIRIRDKHIGMQADGVFVQLQRAVLGLCVHVAAVVVHRQRDVAGPMDRVFKGARFDLFYHAAVRRHHRPAFLFRHIYIAGNVRPIGAKFQLQKGHLL